MKDGSTTINDQVAKIIGTTAAHCCRCSIEIQRAATSIEGAIIGPVAAEAMSKCRAFKGAGGTQAYIASYGHSV